MTFGWTIFKLCIAESALTMFNDGTVSKKNKTREIIFVFKKRLSPCAVRW